MDKTNKITLLLILTVLFQVSFAQYNTVQINLEVVDNETQNCKFRISLFKDADECLVPVKHQPVPDIYNYKESDTIFTVNESDFNLLVDSVFQLSNSQIFNFISEKSDEICKYTAVLELRVGFYDNIVYKTPCFGNYIENRNLYPLISIVKKIFEFANIDYKKYSL